MAESFHRDRLTWVAYIMIAWFAYLQASPGLVVEHLRDELRLSHSAGALHVTAFAAGSMLAGTGSARFEATIGRRVLLWWAAALMAAGAIGLVAGRAAPVTVGSVLVMGIGGGLVLATSQTALADRHGALRAVALTEANVVAGVAYLVLIGTLSITGPLDGGWRGALLVSFVVPVFAWWNSRCTELGPAASPESSRGRLSGEFWVAAVMVFCMAASEWCINAWGASFMRETAGVSADVAVTMMGGYFLGVLIGRACGSRLARRHEPARLLAIALAVAAAGFAIWWSSITPWQTLTGLALLGVGLGNLFPLGLSVAVALAPQQTAQANGRAVMMSSFAVVLMPFAVGALADLTSLKSALGTVAVMLGLSAVGLAWVNTQARRRVLR